MIMKEIVERSSDNPPSAPQPPKAPSKAGFPAPRRRQPPPPRPSTLGSDNVKDKASYTQQEEDKSGVSTYMGETIPHVNFQNPFPASSTSNSSAQRGLTAGKRLSEVEQVQRQVDEENRAKVEGMTDEERGREREELLERFGPGLLGLMAKRKQLREIQTPKKDHIKAVKENIGPVPEMNGMGAFDVEKVKREVEGENMARVESMSVEEREQERRDLEDRFGKITLDALKKRAEKRQAGSVKSEQTGEVQVESYGAGPSRPRQNKVRFDEMDPESLKEKYFRDTPSEPAKLAWIQPQTTPSDDKSIRFDLNGNELSFEDMKQRSTSEGLHHHGSSPDLAGYTIDDVLWLSRSTVSSQRIIMLGLLGQILRLYSTSQLSDEACKAVDVSEARRKGVQMGIDIVVSTSRSVGILQAGIEVLYEGLGGETWGFMDKGNNRYRPDNDSAGIGSVPFDELIDRFGELLSGYGLQPVSIYQLLRILRRAVLLSKETAEVIAPVVPLITKSLVLSAPVPLNGSNLPSIEALHLLKDVIDSSRTCASAISELDLVDSLLRFLVVSTWPEDAELESQYAIVTLRIFTSLARYGLSTSIVTSALDIVRPLGNHIMDKCRSPMNNGEEEAVMAYWTLLEIWTICAIDPHKTTPEHALTWAQVSAMGWNEEALEVVDVLSADGKSIKALSAALRYLCAWLEGIRINSEIPSDIKKEVISRLRQTSLHRLVGSTVQSSSGGEEELALLEQILRLDNLIPSQAEDGLVGSEGQSVLIERYLSNRSTETRHLRYHLLRMTRHRDVMEDQSRIALIFGLLSDSQPGEEPEALNVVDQLLSEGSVTLSDLGDAIASIEHRDKLQILRPLLHHTVLPSADHVVGPRTPTQIYLKATTTLRRPPTDDSTSKLEAGLPLSPDWVFSPLNELLDSASSEAIKQAPPDWDPSEMDIARATLALARLYQTVSPGSMSRSEILFGLMKIFMLEKDNQSSGNHPEVFRDDHIVKSLDALIDLRTRPDSEKYADSRVTIEFVASRFLGPDMPFYQFYQDFLALFEAISFSDKRFAQLVVAPLSMLYPTDFRKLLWVEQATALRSIRISFAEAPCERGTVTDYFLPRETDKDILAGYVRALASGWVTPRQGFLWAVGTWHLACLFWTASDSDETIGKEGEEIRKTLLRVIVSSGRLDVIREVVRLDINEASVGLAARVEEEELERRLSVIEQLLGIQGRKKVKSVVLD